MPANGSGGDEGIEVVDITMSSPPPSPANGKRKANGGNSSRSPEKKVKTNGTIELSGRKVLFTQAPYERSIPRRRLLELQMVILDAQDAGKEVEEIPEEFWDLVAMAGHELTSSTEATFVKVIRAELNKGQDDLISAKLIEPLVSKLFTLKQYGFVASDFGTGASRFPASLQIRCWEANDVDKFFPADLQPSLNDRRAYREKAREECIRIAAEMDDTEKHDFLKGDRKGDKDDSTPSAKLKQTVVVGSRDVTPTASSSRHRSSSPMKHKTPKNEEEAKQRQEEREAKAAEREEKRKEQDEKKAEREAKRLELEEKKAAKEQEEQRKAEVKAKQARAFGSFFAKAKSKTTESTVSRENSAESPSKAKGSDFHRTFKPPPQRANVEWMPINQFASSCTSLNKSSTDAVSGWTPREFIKDHLVRHKCRGQSSRPKAQRGLKSAPLFGSVAEVWTEYQESHDPRLVVRKLHDSERYPWKTLAFDQQARPPYSGTFTRASVVVGPRTPFAQDPLFDYSYDSGDDWQEDEGGEDVDEPAEADPEGDEVASDEDEGEFDDWLDDSEDVMFTERDADGDVPMIAIPPPGASPNKLVAKPSKNVPVKRITKLNPTWRGPVWEAQIGEAIDGMDTYRIQLLNDAPSCIDPFKYESSEPIPCFKAQYSDTAVGMHISVKCLLSTEETVAPKVAPATAATVMPLGDASSSTNVPAGGRSRSAPKVSFPASHLPDLLRLIEGSTKIQSDLVSELRGKFDSVATKAAIEAKVREVAAREGKSKDSQWRVKSEAWAAVGLVPPARGLMAVLERS